MRILGGTFPTCLWVVEHVGNTPHVKEFAMGLDPVELVMEVEDEFGICLPDEREVWSKLQRIVGEVAGVAPGEVTREARLVGDLGLD